MTSILTELNDQTLAEIRAEQALRLTTELFLLFSLGSQYDHLIKMSFDRQGVFCLVADPAGLTAADVATLKPTGIVLSGGPASVHIEVPPFDTAIFDLGIPVLGICLGFQLWAAHRGAQVVPGVHSEYGAHPLRLNKNVTSVLLAGIDDSTPVLESHVDNVLARNGLKVLAATHNAPLAAAQMNYLYGVQFHPECSETIEGDRIFNNFCFGVCGARDRYPAPDVAATKIAQIRETVRDGKVLLALSGGSDSSVVAYLLREALQPGQMRAVYIQGIDRPDDRNFVQEYFDGEPWLELVTINATEDFLRVLAGQVTMKDKRIAMRSVYKAILEDQAAAFGAQFIAQGTLYTDLTESGFGHNTGATKARIKLHHNTGLEFNIEELTPLDDQVKDTAREIGRAIGAPEVLMSRHPFPGPGLVVRIEGEITAESLHVARLADDIFIAELRRAGLYDSVWQAGAVVTQSVTTCTKGDDATEGVVLALWAVWSVDGHTAQWAELPYNFLRVISQKLTNQIRGVGRVVYNISDKPPATIEWG